MVTYWSIVLAIAQWRQNARATLIAVNRLRAFGIGDREIFARRRASSSDSELGAILRLAVTIVIARGHLLAADLHFAERHGLDTRVSEVDACAEDALALIDAIGAADVYLPAAIDMEVGDY
jgi:hypothetical protein